MRVCVAARDADVHTCCVATHNTATDGNHSTLSVGEALSDAEDRSHDHGTWTAEFVMESRKLAALGGKNTQGAAHGTYELTNGAYSDVTSGLPFTQLLLCTLDEGSTVVIPYGTIAFFNTTGECPETWEPYEQVDGRFLVPRYDESSPSNSAHDALTAGDALSHTHTYDFSTTVVKDNEVDYVLLETCCNDDGADAQDYEMTGTSNSVDDAGALPYYSMLTCLSLNETFDSTLPSGGLIFSEVSCSPGFRMFSTISGRVLVGLPEDGR